MLEIIYGKLAHVHDCANIELVYPMSHFIDP